MTRGATKPLLILAAGTLAIAGIGGYAWYESRRPPVLEVYIFDTPGMPSTFIRTPDDRRILIGGGANADIVRRLTVVLPFYSRRIDTVIIPDTDAKNVTGLVEVMNRYDVGKVMIPAVTLQSLELASSTDPAFEALNESVRLRSIPITSISMGDDISTSPDVSVQILFPADPSAFKYSKASGPSLVFRVAYGDTSILFTGSATPKVQKFIATSSPVHSDVLVVSHSLTGSNFARELLDVTRPDYLVYSQAIQKSGKGNDPHNKKADPLAGILGNKRFNIKEKGEVKIVSDGRALSII